MKSVRPREVSACGKCPRGEVSLYIIHTQRNNVTMVYLRSVLTRATVALVVLSVVLLALGHSGEGASAKIAYTKPINNGKPNAIREERLKQKSSPLKTPSKTTTTTELLAKETTATTPMLLMATTVSSAEEVQQQQKQVASTLSAEASTTEMSSETGIAEDEKADNVSIEENNPLIDNTFPGGVIETPIAITTSPSTTEHKREPVPCTCGIFMASQLRRGANEPPLGPPVIVNELDRNYACSAVGQKQCQTKCLETIVQHLPNSANILCATLNRDCRKERAYLFIKNCRNQWWNTTLTAGREYCCKNGKPYACPLV